MTLYNAVAHKEGKWWVIEVHKPVPHSDEVLGVTQARNIDEAWDMASDYVVSMLEVDAKDVEIDLRIKR